MIKYGKAKLYSYQDYGGGEFVEIEKIFNIYEKVNGTYKETLVNVESSRFHDTYSDTTELSLRYDTYVNCLAETAINTYKMANETLTWLVPLAEV